MWAREGGRRWTAYEMIIITGDPGRRASHTKVALPVGHTFAHHPSPFCDRWRCAPVSVSVVSSRARASAYRLIFSSSGMRASALTTSALCSILMSSYRRPDRAKADSGPPRARPVPSQETVWFVMSEASRERKETSPQSAMAFRRSGGTRAAGAREPPIDDGNCAPCGRGDVGRNHEESYLPFGFLSRARRPAPRCGACLTVRLEVGDHARLVGLGNVAKRLLSDLGQRHVRLGARTLLHHQLLATSSTCKEILPTSVTFVPRDG